MKIIFFGSSHFAVPGLKALVEKGCKVLCVVTQPDRKKGRGLHLEGTPVKQAALALGLKIYQPRQINGPEAIKFLNPLAADLFIVISYGQILSQEVLDIPKIFSVNAHASLLPKYRGAAPINWALINGEKTTGVTIMKMVRKMDAGPLVAQEKISVAKDDTFLTLEGKLSKAAAPLLLSALDKIKNNGYALTPQEEEKATLAPKLKKEDGLIDWRSPAEKIHNLIRGCLGWPGAFTYHKGRLLKIFRAEVVSLSDYSLSHAPGKIIKADKHGIIVAAAEGDLMIRQLQTEGKRMMEASDFIAGHKVCVGETLGKK